MIVASLGRARASTRSIGHRMPACSWVAGSGVWASAVAELELAGLEVLLELRPFGDGLLSVLFGRTHGPPGVEERTVSADQVVLAITAVSIVVR